MGRFVIVILDGVGAGALPDAAEYGDVGSNTLGNLADIVDLHIPNLARLGLGNVVPMRGVPPVDDPSALPGRLAETSAGKDTTAGHWEHMGVVTDTAFPTYPDGFPPEVLGAFEREIGRPTLGNIAASGTEIIAELGRRHLETGYPIVYTSADSVFQIAAHVEVIPLEELYRYCQIARDLLTGPHAVGRVIARPFEGAPGAFVRTKDRKDFSLEPTGTTYLDLLVEAGIPVVGIGKIYQIFAGRGVTEQIKVASNDDNLDTLIEVLERREDGLIFTNLVDFDMVWGHRNDVEGFAAGLEGVDRRLPEILAGLTPDDRLLITADHGVDPTTVSTDHSREYVPLLYYPRPGAAPDKAYAGLMRDTGATAYRHLTGGDAVLGGSPIQDLAPARGWETYPWDPLGKKAEDRSCPRPSLACPDAVTEAAAYLTDRLGQAPSAAIVLGSGLDAVADAVTVSAEIPYADIPGWVVGGVAGHSGRLTLGRLGGHTVCLLRGRVHAYEGFDVGLVQLAVRTLGRWGVGQIILTNASGGLDTSLRPGEVAAVVDVLDLQVPLPSGEPDRLAATDRDKLQKLRRATEGSLREVTYVALPGPQYETEAEVAVLRALGAQTVGMSTAQEVRAARESNMVVTVLTVVTNMAGESGIDGEAVHHEVVEASAGAAARVADVVASLFSDAAEGVSA